jgi:hypothetical protein
MSATRFFRADGVSPMWGVGPGCDAGPVSVGWSPLASAGALTVALLRWITLSSCCTPHPWHEHAEIAIKPKLDVIPLLQVPHGVTSSLSSDFAVLAPEVLGAPSESVQVTGVVHLTRGHLGVISLASGSP